jgi:hypothetical protein
VIKVLGWYNSSVKIYTSFVETKLVNLLSECLQRQERLEENLEKSFDEIKRLEKINESLAIKVKHLELERPLKSFRNQAIVTKKPQLKNTSQSSNENNSVLNSSNTQVAVKREIEDPDFETNGY